MKFNNITKKACLGATALLTAISFNSCTDKNDWDVDASYDRIFHTTSLSVSPQDDHVGIEFKLMPNTAKYIVEISTDTLNNDVTENANGNSIIQELTSSPDTVYNLQGTTKYYIRLRGVSAEGKSSNWKYLDKYSFKTKSEQIIENVVPDTHTADVYFKAGKQIDAAYIYKDGDSVKQDVTAAEIEAGMITLRNLQDNASYKVKLWNGNVVRGTYSFKTNEAYPEGYQVIKLAADDDINTILANAENDKVVIVFPQGMDYKTPVGEDGKNKVPTIPANIKSVYFWGAAGDNKPTLHPLGIKFDKDANRGIIRFYNLNLENNGKSDNYILNISGTNNIESLEIEKCNISKTRGVVRFQSISNNCTVGKVSIKNCVISEIGSYGVFNSKGTNKMTISGLDITNSTIYGVEAGALVNTQNPSLTINVDHCTIYKCVQTGKSMFDLNKLNDSKVIMSNCLIGLFYNTDGEATIKGVSMKNQQEVTNTFYTNDQKWNAGYELGDEISGSSTDFWENAENGDFTIKNAFKSQYENYGDPRWIVTE